MSSDVYDSDDALNRSPRLQPSVVNYGPDDSILPLLQQRQQGASVNGKRDSSSSSTSSEGRSPKRGQNTRGKPSLAYVVLLDTLAPNRPDIARQIGEGSPPVETDSEDDSQTRTAHISSTPKDTQAVDAENAFGRMTEKPKPSLPSFQESFQGLLSQDPIFPVKQTLPPGSLKPLRRRRQDSLAATNVGKYTIPPPNNIDFLQASTPLAAGLSENSQNLPSIGQALASLESGATPTPFTAPTPTSPPTELRAAEEHPEGLISGTNMYKCPYPGCTAGAFQTQYLLDSHANVHSRDRPHFCPVAGCAHGIGGKGFKRKNEMIRHGLVHDSPGYECPFCTDQQHKYPRPDNLQRHVRVHHVDKDKDDPVLRDVLAQRPNGRRRGRRRRGHS